MPSNGVDTARFIHFMNDLFDSVNSSISTEANNTITLWNLAIAAFHNMKFIKRKPADKERPEVLQNWIRTLENFKILINYLRDFGFCNVNMLSFNQDALEIFFGQIKQHGTRNTNPNCSAFRGYYRTLLLNSYSQLVHADTNCESEESASFLISVKKFLSNAATVSTKRTSLDLNYNVAAAPESTVQAVIQRVLHTIRKKN